MRRMLFALLLLLIPVEAEAQSSPGLVYGQVPTAAQWNSYFAGKLNYPMAAGVAAANLGYQPLNPANNLSDVAVVATAQSNLGLAIGSNVEAWSATLDSLANGTYSGASSITTLGTISAGTWQGTVIDTAHGGLGANNGSATGVPVFASGTAAITAVTGSGAPVLANAPTLNSTFIVSGNAANVPGTVSVSGTAVTGSGTTFTASFKPGDTITVTTTSGSETQTVTSVTSATAMVTTAFAGTASGATYATSNTGNQFVVDPNGEILINGSTVSTGSTFRMLRDSSTYTMLGSATMYDVSLAPAMTINAASGSLTGYDLNLGSSFKAIGGATLSSVGGISFVLSLSPTNTGAAPSFNGVNGTVSMANGNTGNAALTFLNGAVVNSSAATATYLQGVAMHLQNNNASGSATIVYGLYTDYSNTGSTTNYAGITSVGTSGNAPTNSSLVLLGTGTSPSGTWDIYSVSTAANYFAGNMQIGSATATAGAEALQVNGALSISSATMLRTYTAFTNGAGSSAGTLTNAPAVGNPTKWIPINDNGTTRYIPAW